ncbi:uncharacterized protein SCHCODRAFT_02638714 [Schizophyllum commune H4-8]|uniref:uncharacterized protein n=1 Tax=Schizophyllum commune (strain H4-8 / FGSC 9210) TaxID=578458 RepID=UPI00215EE6E4|nr:uncharacterized protein SCHCODRAFT_02638714 [Schizophyllum commune H4-8]KAI5887685.1 hypothetical protein SCHCODRAFT_02638714 [Schizophyllum commune H4-8]
MSLETIPDLWFPDGNIVIRVGERVCRVHQSILAANSPVLADMFSVPQPRDGEMYEGLPMMSFPDPPEEVLHWLKSMLLLGYFEVYPSRIAQDKLLATLRLSHKYGVQSLRQRALYHLSIAFPDMGSDRAAASKSTPAAIDGGRTVDFFCRVYAVALEIGARWLLPSVMYNIHSATYLDAEARARLPALMTSQAMLRLLEVGRLVLAHFMPHKLAPVIQWEEEGDDVCAFGGECEDAVRRMGGIVCKNLKRGISTPAAAEPRNRRMTSMNLQKRRTRSNESACLPVE